MKHYSLLFFMALLFASPTLYDPVEQDDIVELQAIELSEEFANILIEFKYLEVFEIDNNNVLRASKDYELAYARNVEQFIIAHAVTEQVIEESTDNYEVVELGGGAKAHCYCGTGIDDCSFKPSSEDGPNRNDFKCAGGCGCSIAVTMNPGDDIIQVQSDSGNWFPSKNFR